MNKSETPFDLTGREWKSFNTAKRKFFVEKAFRYWRGRGFPSYRLSESEIISEFRRLERVTPEQVIAGNEIRGSNVGLRLANFFHPQMWEVRVSRYMSPVDCFLDDSLLRAAIWRAFTIWPDRHGASASCLRRMLKTFSSCASVSNFRPTVSRALILKYSSFGDVVVDFAAGYGGRLAGCLTLPRHYLGIEPCSHQVRGLKDCIRTIRKLGLCTGTAEILAGCAEEVMAELPGRSAGMVFSSPPYFNWEKYSTQRTQSFMRYRSYPEWLQGFLQPVVFQSYRILAKGGYLAVSVQNGSRIPLRENLLRAAIRAGFKLTKTYQLSLSKVPYLNPRDGKPTKEEPLLVLRK